MRSINSVARLADQVATASALARATERPSVSRHALRPDERYGPGNARAAILRPTLRIANCRGRAIHRACPACTPAGELQATLVDLSSRIHGHCDLTESR